MARTNMLRVRMSAREWQLLHETADFFELTMSELVRDAVRRHCVYLQHGPQPFPPGLRQEPIGKRRQR